MEKPASETPNPNPDGQSYVVAASGRLDAFLAAMVPALSRRKAAEACERGQVLVDGRPGRPGKILAPGQRVELTTPYQAVAARPWLFAESESVSLLPTIVYEDEHLLVAAKPSGMHSVTLRADDPPTLADFVAAHCPSCLQASADPREAGLVQRLDHFTSGLIVAAKDRKLWDVLHRMFTSHEVEKTYFALVHRHLYAKGQEIRLALAPSADRRTMVAARAGEGVSASTTVVSSTQFPEHELQLPCSLVSVTGAGMRRHQVRAHLASIGHPLLGDQLYGSTSTAVRFFPDNLPDVRLDRPGFFLHAQSIAFKHPATKNRISVETDSTEFSVRLLPSKALV